MYNKDKRHHIIPEKLHVGHSRNIKYIKEIAFIKSTCCRSAGNGLAEWGI